MSSVPHLLGGEFPIGKAVMYYSENNELVYNEVFAVV